MEAVRSESAAPPSFTSICHVPPAPPIPDDVRRFVLTSIPSVPYLEAVLLFQRTPSTTRSADDVAMALYVQPQVASDLLTSLCQAGFLARAEERFRYAPRDAARANALDRLAMAYFNDLVGVTKLIHDQTQKNASRFADAFRLRKDS